MTLYDLPREWSLNQNLNWTDAKRTSDIIVVCFEDGPNALADVKSEIAHLAQLRKVESFEDMHVIVAQTKCDQGQMASPEVLQYCQRHQFAFISTSAKTDSNVSELLELIARISMRALELQRCKQGKSKLDKVL